VYLVSVLEECSLRPSDAFVMKSQMYDLKVVLQVTPAMGNFLQITHQLQT